MTEESRKTHMKRKTLMSWSSGKDSAWALHKLQQNPEINLVGLFCTINKTFNRVAMHAVRTELLQQQAKSIGLHLEIIEIPYPCSNEAYEETMALFVEKAKKENIEYFAFGDLFLEDVRNYRAEKLKGTEIEPIFPLWGIPTEKLSREMISSGLRSVITCIDPKQIPSDFVGKEYNESFLNDIPEGVDPCGENGEFHSFVFDGPIFREPIEISLGEVIHRDGFVFVDVSAKNT
jgi:uncharacterized protein (TIGR00290 family)